MAPDALLHEILRLAERTNGPAQFRSIRASRGAEMRALPFTSAGIRTRRVVIALLVLVGVALPLTMLERTIPSIMFVGCLSAASLLYALILTNPHRFWNVTRVVAALVCVGVVSLSLDAPVWRAALLLLGVGIPALMVALRPGAPPD
jgi:hypothetical protein